MQLLVHVKTINWDAISALAAWVEILIIFIPAISYFFYSKINYVNYWLFKQTPNGIMVALHNKSKSSLFILQQEVVVKNRNTSCIYRLPLRFDIDTNYIRIEPDNVIYVSIDYEIYNISFSDKIILKTQFGGKSLKQVKRIKRG